MTEAKKLTSKINITQLQNVLIHIINTNKTLQEKGHIPTALNVIGTAGLGKTTVIKEIGKTVGFQPENIVKLNLATLDEIGDLIGIPVTEYKMAKKIANGEEKPAYKTLWVKEAAMNSYIAAGFKITNDSRMSYSTPEWISGKKGPGLLILDDYTRASQRFTQAVMELIEGQEYVSWKLPQGWTIVLSSNPDDGNYIVTDQDPAQRSRYMNVELGWDAEIWAKWAEQHHIDGRCINFILMNKEIVDTGKDEVNARSITKFFNTISTIPDFNTTDSLEMIQLLGEGSLGVEVTTQFTAFIHNKLDTLISSKEILDEKITFVDVEKRLKKLIKGNNAQYRGDIAFVITTRLLNHIQFNMKEDEFTDHVKERMADLIQTDVLGSDLKFILGRRLINLENGAFVHLCLNEAVVDNILE